MGLVSLDVKNQYHFAQGEKFGETGSYEVLEGSANFGFNPECEANSGITDIGSIPQDSKGRVQCTSDIRILRPLNAERGNRRVLIDIVNRGGDLALRFFNDKVASMDLSISSVSGNGFLMRSGYTIVQCGWQYDLPDQKGLIRLHAPEALNRGGSHISGRIRFTFQPNESSTTQPLKEEMYRPAPLLPADLNDPEAILTVRDRDAASPQIIARDQWCFGRLESGKLVADATAIYMKSGFVAGKVYQLVYTVAGARVSGLGLLVIRDIASHSKYGGTGQENLVAEHIERVYGFGVSQTGRFIRLFLYLGLNVDEQGRQVFDGLVSHVGGGRRAEFNSRFAQCSSLAKRTASYLFPFTDAEQIDPGTGRRKGLLSRQQARGGVPRIFFTNTSTEYYGSLGSLIHTDVEGTRDMEPSEDARIYVFCGTQHSPGSIPLSYAGTYTTKTRHPANVVDYRPLLRAALVNLDRWISQREPPPPSRYPRVADGTLVPPHDIAATFDAIPGVTFPKYLRTLMPSDYAPGFEEGRAQATADAPPLPTGMAFTNLVPAVDVDGNELGGIRLPDVAVPLATHTGWNMRHPEVGGAEQLVGLTGASIPFPVTCAAREASGDPRVSIEERYASKKEYVSRVEEIARQLVTERYLLPEDLETVLVHASQRYDLLTSQGS